MVLAMKRIALVLLFCPLMSWAGCYGSDSYQTCDDDSGNHYSVQRYGDTTTVHGNNYNTGSSWDQTSTRSGNQTYTNGHDADGNPWHSTTTDYGNGNYSVQGTDSQGNYFSRNCNQSGCNQY